MYRIFVRLLPLLGVLFWPFAAYAEAGGYPARSIRLVVPTPPAALLILLARTIAQHLGPALNQTIVIENQAGAGGHRRQRRREGPA